MRPIFVGGCDRSGTTLLGAMLGAHPDAVAVPEMQFKVPLLTGSPSLEAVRDDWRLSTWGLELEGTAPERDASGREVVEWLVGRYAQKSGRGGCSVWVDHTPLNVRIAPTLSREFPDGKLVHVVRDGRGVAASLIRVDWGPNTVEAAAHYWLEGLAPGLAAETAGDLLPVRRVRFEDLVAEPERTLRDLCDWLELEFAESMTAASGFTPPSYARSTHGLVGRSPDASRLEAWRHELSEREVEIFESVVGQTLGVLGYEERFGAAARPSSRAERVRARVREAAVKRTNKLRSRKRLRLGA